MKRRDSGTGRSTMMSRRQALVTLATATAGAVLQPRIVLSATPVRKAVRFAVIGDWGTGDSDQYDLGRQMLESHRALPIDFVLGAGDNIYPNGSGKYFEKNFERPFASLLEDRVPFYTVLGNHDVDNGRSDQCNYPLFNMKGRCYYTLHEGGGLIDIFMLDTTDYDAAQAGWFEEELRRSTARWKVAVFHHPLYSSGKKHGSNKKLRRRIEPLLSRYGVNTVFSGHDHIYERVEMQHGVQYFVTGAGGKMRRGGVDIESGFCAASYAEDNHFMVIEVDDHRISFQAIDEPGGVVDQGVIRREPAEIVTYTPLTSKVLQPRREMLGLKLA